MFHVSGAMEDEEAQWPDGQCSRTSGYRGHRREVTSTRRLETVETVRKTTSFNISSIVSTSSHASIPVGVVTARQRVTSATTNLELATSQSLVPPFLTPTSSSSSTSTAPSPYLAPSHHLLQPHLLTAPPPPPSLVSPIPLAAGPAPAAPPLYPPYMYAGYPDQHYYYFLQQQLLLLHHHHYLQSQVPSLPLPVPNHPPNLLQSFDSSLTCIKPAAGGKPQVEEIVVDKIIHNTEVSRTQSCHESLEKTKGEDENILQVESSQVEEEELPRGSDDSSDHVTTDESFINVEEDDAVHDSVVGVEEATDDTTGPQPPAGGGDVVAEDKGGRRVRFASADCSPLQLLCDVATKAGKLERSKERSKSLDWNITNKEEDEMTELGDTKPSHQDDDKTEGGNESIKKKHLNLGMKIAKKKRKHLKHDGKIVKIEKLKKKNSLRKIKVKKVKTTLESAVETDKDKCNAEEPASIASNVNILTSFTETFQKFKKSYLSKNSADCKNPQVVPKKIPTLENWTTIMQENRMKKDAEKLQENKCLNNNLKIENIITTEAHIKVEESFIKTETISQQKEDNSDTDASSPQECLKDSNEDVRNNNEWHHDENADIKDFLSFKKKLKFKKKYKDELDIPSKENIDIDNCSKKKKKKKKEKKEKKEKERTEKKVKERKEKKREKEKKQRQHEDVLRDKVVTQDDEEAPTLTPSPPSCTLTSTDLRDGLRVLLRLGGHFHPSRLTEISAPDIYGIVVDKERGNKPHILSQEEVLQRAVTSKYFLPSTANVLLGFLCRSATCGRRARAPWRWVCACARTGART